MNEDLLYFSKDGLAPIVKNGKWGFINTNGDIVIKPIYEKVWPFSNGLAAVAIKSLNNYEIGFIDKLQQTKINFIETNNLSQFPIFENGYFVLNNRIHNDKGVVLEVFKNLVAKSNFNDSGIASVYSNIEGEIIINVNGEKVDDPNKIWGRPYRNGVFRKKSRYYYKVWFEYFTYNKKKNEIQKIFNDYFVFASLFENNISVVRKRFGKKLKVINKKGKKVGRYLKGWNSYYGLNDGYIHLIKKNRETNFLNYQTNKMLFPKDLIGTRFYYNYSNGMIKFSGITVGTKIGYINPNGDDIKDKYDSGTDFKNGFAMVTINNMSYYINKQGQNIGDVPIIS